MQRLQDQLHAAEAEVKAARGDAGTARQALEALTEEVEVQHRDRAETLDYRSNRFRLHRTSVEDPLLGFTLPLRHSVERARHSQ